MNQPRMIQGRTGNISASPGGAYTIVCNRYSYQVPDMVGTNASTNKNHKLYNSTVQEISRGGGDWATKVGALCDRFVYMGSPVKTQVENGMSKLFNFWGHTINTSEQAVFTLNYSVLHDEEVNKINTSDPLTAAQRRSGRFLSFAVTVHPDQADPNCKHIRMTCRVCVQLPMDVDVIYAIINT